MTQSTGGQFNAFLNSMKGFVDEAQRVDITRVFPGALMSLGDSITPVSVPVPGEHRSFIFRIERPKPVILNFSLVHFFGYIGDGDELVNVSEYATCSQSSIHETQRHPNQGVYGPQFTLNVHTLKEEQPWWRADFPANVRVTHIFFYHRPDIASERLARLQIVASGADGDEVILHSPGTRIKRHVLARLGTAIEGLQELSASCPEEDRADFEALVVEALSSVATVATDLPVRTNVVEAPEKQPIQSCLYKFWQKITRRPASVAPLSAKPKQLSEEQASALVGAAGKLIAALDISLNHVGDFGFAQETGLKAYVAPRTARYIRLRAYGSKSNGFGGLELFNSAAGDETVAHVARKDLKFRYYIPASDLPEVYALNLTAEIGSRVVDLGKPVSFDRFNLWNINRAQAGTTLLTQISISNDQENWTSIYDHGATYKGILKARVLIDMLLRNKWPTEYASLIGRLYTLYRRRQLSKPLGKVVGHNKALIKAIGAGSDAAMAQTKHAVTLRFTKHGLQVPISEMDQGKILEDLVDLRDKLRALGLRPLLMYGTLLGAIREKDFIQHDDDLDIAIIADGLGKEDLMAERDRVASLLEANDIPCKRRMQQTPLIHCKRSEVTIDIFILGHKDGKIYWPHRRLIIVEEEADIFLPITTMEFKGETFDIPRDPEAVSEARYGSGWRVPEPTFEL